MTRLLAHIADISYRRRGRMVLAWIAAAIVLIGLGSALKGDYNADYNTPGSESKAASALSQRAFGGYSGQEVYVVWRTPAGPRARLPSNGSTPSSPKRGGSTTWRRRPRSGLDERHDRDHLAAAGGPWREMTKEDGERLIDAAERNSRGGLEIKLGGDAIYAAQESTSPEGFGFLGAAIVLLIAFGSLVAAGLPLAIALVGLGITSGGLIALLANVIDVPDWTTAVVGADRNRRRNRLRAAGADPLPGGDERRQGPPRCGGRGGHDRRAQRDDRRLHGGHRRPWPLRSPACRTCTGWRSRRRWRCWW